MNPFSTSDHQPLHFPLAWGPSLCVQSSHDPCLHSGLAQTPAGRSNAASTVLVYVKCVSNLQFCLNQISNLGSNHAARLHSSQKYIRHTHIQDKFTLTWVPVDVRVWKQRLQHRLCKPVTHSPVPPESSQPLVQHPCTFKTSTLCAIRCLLQHPAAPML